MVVMTRGRYEGNRVFAFEGMLAPGEGPTPEEKLLTRCQRYS